MTTRLFRQHHEVPPAITSSLYRHLLAEWVAIGQQPATRIALRRWGRAEPALANHQTPGDIVDAIDNADYAGADEILIALIRRFQSGHQLAGRILLQALLPKLCRLAHYSRDADYLDAARQTAIAEFWQVITDYNPDRTRKVAITLALNTLRAITHHANTPEIPTAIINDLAATTEPAPSVAEPEAATFELTNDADLTQVIHWARRENAITDAEAEILTISYTHDTYGFTEAAHRFGITAATVRKRCERATRKLAAAVRAELQGTATITQVA